MTSSHFKEKGDLPKGDVTLYLVKWVTRGREGLKIWLMSFMDCLSKFFYINFLLKKNEHNSCSKNTFVQYKYN